MYSVDGVPLDNPTVGWSLEAATAPLSGHSAERSSVRVPGLPGVVAGIDHPLEALTAPTVQVVVQHARALYDPLAALLNGGTVLSVTADSTREAPVECLTVSPAGLTPMDAIINTTAMFRLPGVFWRDTATTTTTAALGSASVTVDAWTMTGLVTDAIIRVRGAVTGLKVASDYAYFQYAGTLTGSQYLRYECATGRAWVTSSDTWSGGTEVSVTADGPGGKFGVFPARISATVMRARLVVTTTTRTSAQIEVRGKGAYLA